MSLLHFKVINYHIFSEFAKAHDNDNDELFVDPVLSCQLLSEDNVFS